MRDARRILAVLPLVFAGCHTVSSMTCLAYYIPLYFLMAKRGEIIGPFLAQHGFIGMYLGGVVVAALMTVALGIFVWVISAKSAKDRTKVERLIDNWVTSLSRSDR